MTFKRIFVGGFIIIAALLSAGCNKNSLEPVRVPDEISAVTLPFLDALKRGDEMTAEKFISKSEIEYAREEFGNAKTTLETGPNLKPLLVRFKPTMFGQSDQNDVVILYAAKQDDLWTSVELRLFRLDDEPYEIEYFEIHNEQAMPAALAMGEQVKNWTAYGMAAMALFALLFLFALIWFVRRKAHIIAPDQVTERRAPASTSQDQ